jgi:hypothetical protein
MWSDGSSLNRLGSLAHAAWAASAPPIETRNARDECFTGKPGGVPGCTSVASKKELVGSGEQRDIRMYCPHTAQYFWNWSAIVSPGMHITLLRTIDTKSGLPRGAWVRLHEQTGLTPGQTRLFFGCSTQIPTMRGRLVHYGNHPVEGR